MFERHAYHFDMHSREWTHGADEQNAKKNGALENFVRQKWRYIFSQPGDWCACLNLK